MRPASSRYAVTTREPGASEVLTVGGTRSPRRTALRASSPAPTITVGFEVFVHEVIAAMATEPVRIVVATPRTARSKAVDGEHSAARCATGAAGAGGGCGSAPGP